MVRLLEGIGSLHGLEALVQVGDTIAYGLSSKVLADAFGTIVCFKSISITEFHSKLVITVFLHQFIVNCLYHFKPGPKAY